MDPATGIRDWYASATAVEEKPAPPITWSMILASWMQLELDMHETFGIDVESGILAERTWRWFEVRVAALIGQDGRLTKAVTRLLNEVAA